MAIRYLFLNVTMNKMHAFFGRLRHFPILPLAAVMLVILAWSSPAFCGKIHDAVEQGDLEKVKALLHNTNLVFSKDDHGRTPLHMAVVAIDSHKDMNGALGSGLEI